jgi:hypothetical protein
MKTQANNLDKYQKLIMQHAKYSDLIKELKQKGGEEYGLCFGVDLKTNTLGNQPSRQEVSSDYLQLISISNRVNCIENAIDWMKDSHTEGDYWVTFDEAFADADAEGLVCPHCHEVRRLKRERMKAIAHMGAVRAAMTKMGRKLAQGGVA